MTLDVSNNKLQTLPYNMWKAPKLKELNAAFNLLRELPTNPPEVSPLIKSVYRKRYRQVSKFISCLILDLRLKVCFCHVTFTLNIILHKLNGYQCY